MVGTPAAAPGAFEAADIVVTMLPNGAIVADGPSEALDLVGLNEVHEPQEGQRIAQIAVVQEKLHAVDVGVHVKMIDPLGIERSGAANDAMNLVAFAEEQFG